MTCDGSTGKWAAALTELPDDDGDGDERRVKELPRPTQAALEASHPRGPAEGCDRSLWAPAELYCLDCEL